MLRTAPDCIRTSDSVAEPVDSGMTRRPPVRMMALSSSNERETSIARPLVPLPRPAIEVFSLAVRHGRSASAPGPAAYSLGTRPRRHRHKAANDVRCVEAREAGGRAASGPRRPAAATASSPVEQPSGPRSHLRGEMR